MVDKSLRVVELTRDDQSVKLNSLVQKDLSIPFAPGGIDSEEGREELVKSLIELRQDRGIRFRNPVVALLEHSYYLKQRPLLQASDRINRQQLQWECRQFLTDEARAFGVDFALTSSSGFIVAANRQLLKEYQRTFRQAGVRGLGFDIPPFALFNVVEAAELVAEEKPELVVDVAAGNACALLVDRGQLCAVAQCSWNGEGIPDEHLSELQERLAEIVEKTGESRPERLWIAGAASRDSRWRANLPDALLMAGALVDPFRGIDISALDKSDTAQLTIRSAFAVPVGLAYRGLR